MEKTNCRVIGLDVKSFMEAGAGGREIKKKERGRDRKSERKSEMNVYLPLKDNRLSLYRKRMTVPLSLFCSLSH